MKIKRSDNPKALQGKKRISSTGASDGTSFADELSAASAETAADAATGPVATSSATSLGMILAAQAEEGDAAGRQAKTRADVLLTQLDRLHADLINGSIPKEHLTGLAHTIKTARGQTLDPHLNDILDEIDLRAQVELAKYEQGL